MSDDTTNDENFYRQAYEERKGALKVFLRALGDLRGGYLHISIRDNVDWVDKANQR